MKRKEACDNSLTSEKWSNKSQSWLLRGLLSLPLHWLMVWKQRVTSWEETKAPFTSFLATCSTPERSHSHYLCFENGHCWMMSVFKQACFITTSYVLACVPFFCICGSFTPNCGNIVAWTGPSLSVCQILTLGGWQDACRMDLWKGN